MYESVLEQKYSRQEVIEVDGDGSVVENEQSRTIVWNFFDAFDLVT